MDRALSRQNTKQKDLSQCGADIFLTKTEIDEEFLSKVVVQLKKDRGERTREDLNVIANLKEAFERNISKKPLKKQLVGFNLLENEYNFLSQNDKLLWVDYLIFRYKFRVYPLLKKLVEFPVYLLVEPVSYCNLKCSMCFQVDKTFTRKPYLGHIDLGLFRKVIDEAVDGGCKALTMASRGEPLLHPKFSELLKYVNGKFFDLKLNTNAMLLSDEKARHILENEVTELVFSVDSYKKDEYERIRKMGNFERVVSNIRRFHEIRSKEYPGSKCRTRVSGVKIAPDFDTNGFVDFWKAIVDNVACVPVENRWDTYNNKPSGRHSPCPILWERMYVWFDGVVNPCDVDYKSCLTTGDVTKLSLKDIWLGKEYSQLREDHTKNKRLSRTPCDRCPF